MTEDIFTLRLTCDKLGAVQEIKNFLSDIEGAYNHLYAFNVIVDSLYATRERSSKIADERLNLWRQMWKDFPTGKDFPIDPFFFEMFYEDYFSRQQIAAKPSLFELYTKIDFETIIPANDKLQLSKINIQSPGFWEFIGALTPMQQIREFLNDRHEYRKDNNHTNRQGEEECDLIIITKNEGLLNQKITMLRKLRYNENEIRQFIFSILVKPLNLLGRQQDNCVFCIPDK